MSSSGPLRPSHPTAAAASGSLQCCASSSRRTMAAGFASLCRSGGSNSSNSNTNLVPRRAAIIEQQDQPASSKSKKKTSLGRPNTSIPFATTSRTKTIPAKTIMSTRIVSGFMFNFHFLLSLVLFIILCGDLTRLGTAGPAWGFGGIGVWAEELNGDHSANPQPVPFDRNARGDLKFGDKCDSTIDCSFEGSVCDTFLKTCQCTADLPATNHIDKCGKKAQVNETCSFHEQCEQMTEQTECRDNRCICRFEMNPIFKPDGTVECRATMNKPIEPEKYVDPAMIGVLVAMAVMFIIICVVLRLFSKARWRDNRTIFNTPNPRLMNVSLLRDNKLLHGQERRGSRMSVRLPSRQPSMASLRPHSPNASIGKLAGSRRGSRGSSNASATSTRSNRSQHAKDNGTAALAHQSESVTVEISEIRS